MPTYEYLCHKCERTFEVFQSMKDPHLKVCPRDLCHETPWGEGEVKRQLGTGAGLIFKGSGFHITDYRSESYKAGAKSESGAGKTGVETTKKSEGSKKTETQSTGSGAKKD